MISLTKQPALRMIGYFVIRILEVVYRFKTNTHDGIRTRLACILSRYEPGTTAVWRDLSKTSNTILDIGANNGYYAAIAIKYAPKNSVICAVEPNPAVMSILSKNLRDVREKSIILLQLAFGDHNSEDCFYVNTHNTNVGSLSLEWAKHYEPRTTQFRKQNKIEIIKIPVRRGEEVLKDNGVSAVDLMKIDAEGAELEVLTGMTSVLQGSNHIAIIFECNDLNGNDDEQRIFSIWTLLSDMGFSFCGISERPPYNLVPCTSVRQLITCKQTGINGQYFNILATKGYVLHAGRARDGKSLSVS